MHIPKGGVNHIGIVGVENQIHRAGFHTTRINLFPRFATVGGAEDTALFVRSPEMAESSDVDDVGIPGMHADRADVKSILQADVLPGFARVTGFINAVAMRGITADIRLTHADIDDVRIRFRDSDGAHRSGFELSVRYWQPARAAVRSFPDAATGCAEVIHIRFGSDAGHRVHAPAAKWTDAAIFQLFQRIEIWLGSQDRGGKGGSS